MLRLSPHVWPASALVVVQALLAVACLSVFYFSYRRCAKVSTHVCYHSGSVLHAFVHVFAYAGVSVLVVGCAEVHSCVCVCVVCVCVCVCVCV